MAHQGKSQSTSVPQILFLALMLIFSGMSWAQEAADPDEGEESVDLDRIAVTGSRIKRTDLEGPQPITIISAEEIERQGFTTAFEALSSLTQFNGTIQDDQFAGFTQAASTLNLRALGEGRTLILLNGHRSADYPLAFNGQSNAINLANIPVVMIERIEVLSGGASAIYGSDAVAGVVNIILKDEIEGFNASVRYGDTDQGGGETQRAQFSGGFNTDKAVFTFGLEYFKRDPIYAYQRKFMDSLADDPTTSGRPLIDDPVNGVTNERTFLILDVFDSNDDGLTYVDPGAQACAPLAHLNRNSVAYSLRAGRGYYCGTAEGVGNATIRNEKENYSLYTNFKVDLSGEHQLFGTLIYTDSETRTDTGSRFWQFDLDGPVGGGVFINTLEEDVFGIGGGTTLWQRIFTPEESGGPGSKDDIFDEKVFDLTVGFRGPIAGTWDYEASYSRSDYKLERERLLIHIDRATKFFLGDPLGTIDLGFGVPFTYYAADISRMYTPLTPEEYRSISTVDITHADTGNETLQFVATGDLFELPAGAVQMAGVLEAATQDYAIKLDPQLLNGEIFGFTGTGGHGDRDRYAAGIEFKVPLFDTLSASLAGRYDKYDDITRVDDAITYNLGLEWRPIRNLLLRGSTSTSFRAPDMHYVFADASGFFTTVNDEYLCRRDEPGVPFPACTWGGVGIEGARQGSPTLEEEEGEYLNFGFVWEVVDGLSLSVDWYEIELKGAVQDLSIRNLLEQEADCRLGMTTGGQPVDISSQECQDTLSRITRLPFIPGPGNEFISEAIDIVTVGPINTAFERIQGVDTTLNYTLTTDRFGQFAFTAAWTKTLTDESNEFPGDPVEDELKDLQDFDFHSRARAAITWNFRDFTTTLTGIWTGSVPNWEETGRCCRNEIFNWTAGYYFTPNLSASIIVQNIADSNPPRDQSFDSYPYFSEFNYDPYGREWFLQLDYRFGGSR